MNKLICTLFLLLPLAMTAQTTDSSSYYLALADKAIELTEANIYNSDLLNNESWESFKTHVRSMKFTDAESFRSEWNKMGRSLPFSHYYIMRNAPKVTAANTTGTVRYDYFNLKDIDENTCLLTVKSFSTGREAVDPIIDSLRRKPVKNLIVDLRGNTGGTIASALPLAQYLVNEPLYGGIFLTQKYFKNHKTPPVVNEYTSYTPFNEASFDLIIKGIHNSEGLYLIITPDEPTFKGKLYILTDKRTASTCEPFVYGFKHSKRATIIGENTMGAMLNAEIFPLNDHLSIFIPTADYYTADGKRLDKVGVMPDKEVKSEEALNEALRIINQQ